MKYYPYKRGGVKKVLTMLKGGHKMFAGSFFSHTEEVRKRFLLFNRGPLKVLPCFFWGAQ